MAFEYPTLVGAVRLTRTTGGWTVRFAGKSRGRWRSPDAAAVAVARHRTGLLVWDQARLTVSEDLIDWRPLGESI